MFPQIIKEAAKLLIWLIGLTGIFLFIGVFREEFSTAETVILGIVCLIFGIAPYFLRKTESINKAITGDEKNMLILGLGSLFFIYCLAESLTYGLLTLNAALLVLLGIAGLAFSIQIVKPKTEKGLAHK